MKSPLFLKFSYLKKTAIQFVEKLNMLIKKIKTADDIRRSFHPFEVSIKKPVEIPCFNNLIQSYQNTKYKEHQIYNELKIYLSQKEEYDIVYNKEVAKQEYLINQKLIKAKIIYSDSDKQLMNEYNLEYSNFFEIKAVDIIESLNYV